MTKTDTIRAWLIGGSSPSRALTVNQFERLFTESLPRLSNVEQAYASIGWVYRCVQLRMQTVGGMPFRITDRSGNNVDWPLRIGLPDLLRHIEFALCLRGAAFALKLRRGRVLAGLQWLNPATMTVHTTPSGITGFSQRVGAQTREFRVEDIVYCRLPSGTDDLGPGVAPAAVALTAAQLAYNAYTFAERFFANGAIPALLLTTEQTAIPEQEINRIKAWWDRNFGGVKNAWKTAVLTSGLKPTTIGLPTKDLMLIPLLEETRKHIAVAFGIPQTLLEDAANFATAREHKLSFYYETIFPECDLIASALNEQVFAEQNLVFAFAYDQVEAVQQDEATKAQAIIQLFQTGIISRDEARQQLGLEVVAPAASSEQEETEERSGEVRAITENDAVKKLCRRLEQIFDEHWNDVADGLATGNMPDTSALASAIRAALVAALTAVIVDRIISLGNETNNPLDPAQVLTDAAAWAKEYTYELVKKIDETTRAQLREIIAQVVNGTLTRDDAESLLKNTFGVARAEVIAATEITRAEARATTIYAEKLRQRGHKIQERWLTAEDERVCDICGPLDHKLKDVWANQFPDGPPAHPRCRCQVVIEWQSK